MGNVEDRGVSNLYGLFNYKGLVLGAHCLCRMMCFLACFWNCSRMLECVDSFDAGMLCELDELST